MESRLVRREPDPTDGRFTNAILTEKGFQTLVEAAPGHVAHVRSLVSPPASCAAAVVLTSHYRSEMSCRGANFMQFSDLRFAVRQSRARTAPEKDVDSDAGVGQ
jgi:hypothetical protein